MGVLDWLFGRYEGNHPSGASRSSAPSESARAPLLVGDGNYDFEVVGESHCQDALERICGGKTEEGHELSCIALLLNDDGNQYDDNAVAVFVNGKRVGYLPRQVAKGFRHSMKQLNSSQSALGCRALITGGWDRGDDDIGHFGVRLDVARPFRIEATASSF